MGATPVSPDRPVRFAELTSAESRAADLTGCERLAAPAGSKVAYRVYAKGVQIHRWNGTGWTLAGPDAVLSADRAGNSIIGTHYFGPTWKSNSGGTVVGAVLERCTPNPNAIPWLLLSAVSQGPGVFHGVTHIQRVNTVGGNAPSSPGTTGQEVRVAYETEYWFYRAP
jgi:hypothetical protein